MATPAPIDAPVVGSLGAPAPPLASLGALASAGPRAALPSAVACASVSADVDRMNSRPAVTWMSPIVARDVVFARLMPTAAATDTPPPEVFAAGVVAAPVVPLPLLSVDVLAANARSCATC